jgi:hypothetical protein
MAELIDQAREFASAAHRKVGQLRKYSGQPYEEHLRRVAELVAGVTDDPEMVAAAWLHDVVEDTPVTIEEIERAFGREVRDLVDALTDVSRPAHGNRATRKALDREHLARAPARAQTVKLADLIDNCQDICKHNPRFGRVFLGEMAALLEVLTAGDPVLIRRARTMHERWAGRLSGTPQPEATRPLALLAGAQGGRVHRALHVFAHTFCAGDVAEPIAGSDIDSATLATLQSTQLVRHDARLTDVVMVLTRHDRCFVTLADEVTGYIGRDEMQGPVARMWLFGMITTVELSITESIRSAGDEQGWLTLLTPARLEKARALQQSRAGRGRPVPLLDCLQLSDKIRIALEIEEHPRPLFQGASRSDTQRRVRDLEDLRNSLAHAQDIVTHDWAQIARLGRWLEELAAHSGVIRHD